MHCYPTLAILVLAASAVSPAVSAPVRDSVRQDARDPNLGNVPESIGIFLKVWMAVWRLTLGI